MAQQKNTIHMTKRNSRIAGAAIAAALLAANVGGGYLLLNGRNQQKELQAASSLASEIEDASSAVDVAAMPCYVDRMQQFYAERSGVPCNFDFTGLGTDFNETWENDNYKLTLRAVTGCDWVLYYFYDVEPKQGHTKEQYEQEKGPYMQLEVQGTWTDSSQIVSIPMQTGDNIWHYCGMIPNTSGVPFFHEENAPDSKALVISVEDQNDTTEIARKPLDFIAAEYPLEASEQHDPEAPPVPDTENDLETQHLFAQTPFGEFAVHGPYHDALEECKFTTGIDAAKAAELANADAKMPNYQDTFKAFTGVYSLVNAEGEVLREFTNSDHSYTSYHSQDGLGYDCTYMLFTEPADLHAGSLHKTYIDPTVPVTEPAQEKAATDKNEYKEKDIQTENTPEEVVPAKASGDEPRVVYSTGESDKPFDSLPDGYPEAKPEENSQFEQVAIYSKHAKLTLDGKELTGKKETISPDAKNKLNFVFEWTPDTTLTNPDISIEIRTSLSDLDKHDMLIYDKIESQNTVAIEPVEYEDYQDPRTGEWLPASIPDAVAAFTPDPTSEKCLPLRFSLPIDLSKVNDPKGKQLTFWVDYRSADNEGNKKDVVFRQEYIFFLS